MRLERLTLTLCVLSAPLHPSITSCQPSRRSGLPSPFRFFLARFLETERDYSPLLGLLERSSPRLSVSNGASVRNGSVVNTTLDVVTPLGRGAFVVASRDASSVSLELSCIELGQLWRSKGDTKRSRLARRPRRAKQVASKFGPSKRAHALL
jgi:hypothetical protein